MENFRRKKMVVKKAKFFCVKMHKFRCKKFGVNNIPIIFFVFRTTNIIFEILVTKSVSEIYVTIKSQKFSKNI